MSSRIVSRINEANWNSLRHSTTAPNLQIPTRRSTPPRRRQSVAELSIPKRKDSVTFFASPFRNRKNVTWSASTHSDCSSKTSLSDASVRSLRNELEEMDENLSTPRPPKRQNGMVRLTPPPSGRKESSIITLPLV